MEKALQNLDFLSTQIKITLAYYDNDEVNSVQLFALGLLKRLEHASMALKILLNNIGEVPQLDFSAGIIIRAILLDSLIGLNVYKIIKDNSLEKKTEKREEDLIRNFCDSILADGLENTFKYIVNVRTFGFADKQKVEMAINHFFKKYERFFEKYHNDGRMPKLKFEKAQSPNDLFKCIAGDPQMKDISKIYDLYLAYSKYDHFNILYFDVDQTEHSTKNKRLKRATDIFVRHCVNLHIILERESINDIVIERQLKVVGGYWQSINSA